MNNFLLRYEKEDEHIKDFMVKWTVNFDCNIDMNVCEKPFGTVVKLTLSFNLKEYFYKMMYQC